MKKQALIICTLISVLLLNSVSIFGQCSFNSSTGLYNFWPAPIAEGPYELNVTFVDLQNSSSSSFLSLNVSQAKSHLQQVFSTTNIQFNILSDIQYTLSNTDDKSTDAFLINFTPPSINSMYILVGEDGWFVNGASHVNPNILGRCIILTTIGMTQEMFEFEVAHEMGHALGLYHTHGNWPLSLAPYSNIDCGSTGDLICDTPKDPDLSFKVDYNSASQDCELKAAWSSNPDYDNVPLDNIMSYTNENCGVILTCQQAAKARFFTASNLTPFLTSATFLNANPNLIGQDLADITIAATTTWTTPKYVRGVRVLSGNTLTISNTDVFFYPSQISYDQSSNTWTYQATTGSLCTVGYMNCGSIVVEKGAELIIVNSKLTTAECYSPLWWEGIFIEGDRTLSQNGTNQGKVTVTNSIIKNARTAIKTRSQAEPDNIQYSGGIIQVASSTFKNNRRDIEFLSYSNIISGNEFANTSFILNSEFVKNDDYQGVVGIEDFPLGITAWDV